MPLPESTKRTELHLRRIEMRGYRRDDGLYEIDGRVTDTKTQALRTWSGSVAAGTPIHDMWVRLVVDEDLLVHDIVAVSDASPHTVCREAVEPMQAIVGERIRAGWTNRVKAKLGGAKGCTHLMELLIPLATAAYQTIAPVRLARPDVVDPSGRPLKIDSCYAYSSTREIVALRWPDHYRGG
ncbi:MAG TPA: DUF2889 domain-containing protein [Casimicrobiaceae bacterium]|nr:DUF2889 domain-containing protein [Casimicrobiaceae bacterium]